MSVIFFDVVESVDNIIWQSYQTKTNTIIKSQFINYFVRVQIKSPNQNKEFRYLEMIHYPSTNRIETFYVWNPEKRDFELNEQEMMPVYHIEFPNHPIQIYVHETVDMFDKYEDGEERYEEDNIEGDDYYFQNIYEIQIYDLKGEFIDGKATFSLDDLGNLIKKYV